MSLSPAPVVGVAAMVQRDGRFLLVQRGRPPNLGLWAFPGGKQELGETVDAAVRRELKEETGIDAGQSQLVTVLDLIDRTADSSIRFHYTLIVLALEWTGGEACAGGDAAALGWFGLDEIGAIAIIPGTAALIRAAIGEANMNKVDLPMRRL